MELSRALRIGRKDVVTLVGGGGKTTLMFRLAGELAAAGSHVVTTMTTHIFVRQMELAPARLILQDEGAFAKGSFPAQLPELLVGHGHVLIAGGREVGTSKVTGVPPALIDRIVAQPAVDAVIVEGDGSRRLPFKAPAAHEPVVPGSCTILVPVVGLDVLGQLLAPEYVHRPELVAGLSGAALGAAVTPAIVAAVLSHPDGGAKGLPAGARLVPFLNKAEDPASLAAAREIARLLLQHPQVDSVLIGAAQRPEPVTEVWSRAGAVVLAAGRASRYGALKQVLPWHGLPLVAHVAHRALACPDVCRVAVTLGAGAERVQAALATAPDALQVPVADWAEGQSRSVQAGLRAVHEAVQPGSVLFLLADQPGVSPELLSALVQRHRETLAPVVVPRYQGQRGNPVLFDRATFPEFERLSGDIGARPVLQAHRDEIAWVDWPSPEITRDIDTAADYHPDAADG